MWYCRRCCWWIHKAPGKAVTLAGRLHPRAIFRHKRDESETAIAQITINAVYIRQHEDLFAPSENTPTHVTTTLGLCRVLLMVTPCRSKQSASLTSIQQLVVRNNRFSCSEHRHSIANTWLSRKSGMTSQTITIASSTFRLHFRVWPALSLSLF